MVKIQSDIIEYIHKLCRQFAEENLSEEIIFFDGIWEVYEDQLRKWLKKPSKRLRLKLKKRRILRWIGMAEDGHSLDLELPESMNVIIMVLFDAALTEGLSREKSKEIILKYGKNLSDGCRRDVEQFLVPTILNSSSNLRVLGRLILEKDGRKILSPFDLSGDKPLPPPQEEEKKEYMMYTNENQDGIPITRNEFKNRKEEFDPTNKKHLFFIYYDKEKQDFFNVGNPFRISPPCIKFLKLLIINLNKYVLLKPLFEEIAGFTLKCEELDRIKRNRIHTTKKRLVESTLGKLDAYIDAKDNYGYKFKMEEGIKFFLIEDFSGIH